MSQPTNDKDRRITASLLLDSLSPPKEGTLSSAVHPARETPPFRYPSSRPVTAPKPPGIVTLGLDAVNQRDWHSLLDHLTSASPPPGRRAPPPGSPPQRMVQHGARCPSLCEPRAPTPGFPSRHHEEPDRTNQQHHNVPNPAAFSPPASPTLIDSSSSPRRSSSLRRLPIPPQSPRPRGRSPSRPPRSRRNSESRERSGRRQRKKHNRHRGSDQLSDDKNKTRRRKSKSHSSVHSRRSAKRHRGGSGSHRF